MSTLSKFFSIIPQIGCYIRRLSICVLSSSFVDVYDLCDLLKSTPHLTTLRLVGFLSWDITGRITTTSQFKLKTLIIEENEYSTRSWDLMNSLFAILQFFSSIDQLSVHTPVYFWGEPKFPHLCESTIPQDLVVNPGFLHINEIATCDSDKEYYGPSSFHLVFQLIERSVNLSCLVSLNLHNWLLDVEPFRSMVLGAQNLEHLTLTMMIRHRPTIWEGLDLNHCRKLVTFRLCLIFETVGVWPRFTRDDPLEYDLSIPLRGMTCGIHQLSLSLEAHDEKMETIQGVITQSGWREMDDHILLDFPQLQSFTITPCAKLQKLGHTWDGMMKHILEEMPQSTQKGLLKF